MRQAAQNAAVKGRTAQNIVLFLFLTTDKSFPKLVERREYID